VAFSTFARSVFPHTEQDPRWRAANSPFAGGRGFGFSCQARIPIRLPLEDTHERDLRDEIRRVLRDLLFCQDDGLMQFLEPFFAAARLDEYETRQGEVHFGHA